MKKALTVSIVLFLTILYTNVYAVTCLERYTTLQTLSATVKTKITALAVNSKITSAKKTDLTNAINAVISALTDFNTAGCVVNDTPPPPPPTNNRGPQSTITCPSGSVNIPAGSSIQTAINNNIGLTSFCIKAGVTSVTNSLLPKTGNTFVCEYGGIIDGTGWSTTDGTQAAFRAHNQDIDGITIKNCVIQNMPQYAIRAFSGAGTGPSADRWTVQFNEIKSNKYGIELGTFSQTDHNIVHDNTVAGYTGYKPKDVVVDNNEWYANGVASSGVENKVSLTYRTTWTNNYFHDQPIGIWHDGESTTVVINNNTFDDITLDAIAHEVSGSAVIHDDIIRRAGAHAIFISTSQSVEVYSETLVGNFRGIEIFLDCSRAGTAPELPDFPGPWDLKNVNIHDNNVTVSATPASSWAAAFGYTNCSGAQIAPYAVNLTKGLTYQHNAYTVQNVSDNIWLWAEVLKTFTQWKAVPQDSTGTVQ